MVKRLRDETASEQSNDVDTPLESSIYSGIVFHQRSIPKQHTFSYKIYLFWLKLSEIDQISQQVSGFSNNKKGLSTVNFKREDYLGDSNVPLQDAVLSRMNELSETELSGEVFLLGQVRTFGLYFSPVNFYYLRNPQGFYTHLLAEVSNTPWDQRHHYLVDLNNQVDCAKAFHVSPFNPMDMQYKWQVQQPSQNLRLNLSCYKQQKHFEAAINMDKQPLTSASLRSSLMSIPSMTIKTVVGIYWQAIKLFFKRVPLYTHS
jgi:DUF1365 family protein